MLRALPPGWRKRGVQARTVDENTALAVALSPEGARAFDEGAAGIPAVVAQLLASESIRWASGMRFGGTPAGSAVASPANDAAKFGFIELFAGLGGFRLGLEALGGACVFASEIDAHACAAYTRNFGADHLHGDITEVPTEAIPPHDVLTLSLIHI